MYLTKRPGLSYHQKKEFAFYRRLSRISLKLQIHPSKVPCKGLVLKLKVEKYALMGKKVLRDDANKTICRLDCQFKENYGTTFINQIKKTKIMENHVNKKEKKSADKTKVAQEKLRILKNSSMTRTWRGKSHKSKFIPALCHKKH